MVIDDGEHFVVAGVGQIRVDLVGVDQADEVDTADFAHALDLAKLESQELHERAIFTMTKLVAVPDGRLSDAKALSEVSLRDGARDPVRIWVTAKSNEDVFAARSSESFGESTGAWFRRGHVRRR